MSSHLYDYLRGGSSRVAFDFEDEEDEEVPVNVTTKVWYRVKSGDNLTKIARNYGTTVSQICLLNKISAYRKLYVGMKLRVQ